MAPVVEVRYEDAGAADDGDGFADDPAGGAAIEAPQRWRIVRQDDGHVVDVVRAVTAGGALDVFAERSGAPADVLAELVAQPIDGGRR